MTDQKEMASSLLYIDQSVLYRAGAGAGKTTQLIQQIQGYAKEFYQTQKRWPQMIVTTFTRKATQQLKERLLLEALKTIGKTQTHDEISFLKDFLLSRKIHISTIDGLLSLFLKRVSLASRHDPEFQIIDETDNLRWAFLTLRQKLKRQPEFQRLFGHYRFTEIAKLCLKYQSCSYAIPNLKVASLEELMFLSVNHIKEVWDKLTKVDPHNKLMGPDLAQKIHQKLDLCYQGKSFSKNNYDILCELLKRARESISKSKKSFLALHKEDKEQVQQSIDDLTDILDNPPCYDLNQFKKYIDHFLLFEKLARQFVLSFEKIKTDQGLMSIKDLEFTTLNFLQKTPQRVAGFSKEWDYWLIDEYQDTTPLQAKILNQLRGSSKEFVVGDPHQSIYLFRGARSEVFESKQLDVKNVRHLEKNYRSNPSLLYFFNDFFKNMQGHFPKMLSGRTVAKLSSDPVATFTLYDEDSTSDVHVKCVKSKPTKHERGDRAVVARVIQLLNQNVRYQDICIITRTNEDVLRLAQKLGQHAISYQIFISKKSPHLQTQELNTVLKFIVNPHDDLNFLKLLRSMSIPDSDLHQLAGQFKRGGGGSLWQTLLSQDIFAELKAELQTWLADSDERGVLEAMKKACVDMGMVDMCRRRDPSGDLEAYIWKYFVELQSQEQQPGFNYLQFVEKKMQPSDLESDQPSSIESGRVHLMTVHKSKGLEFEHVLIPQLKDVSKNTTTAEPFLTLEDKELWGIPLKNQEDQKKHSLIGYLSSSELKNREQRESDRLLYVAMTRARSSVHLFFSNKKLREGHSSWYARSKCEKWHPQGLLGKQDCDHYSYGIESFENSMPVLKIQPTEQLAHLKERLKPLDHQQITRISVSHLIEDTKDQKKTREKQPIVDLKSSHILQKIKKADLGIAYHKMLQVLCEQPMLIDQDPEKLMTDYFQDFPSDRQAEILSSLHFLLSLVTPPIKKLLKTGCSEWPFLHHQEDRVIEGKIDIWGMDEDVIWVVDYKTGFEASQKAIEQLTYYGQALAEKYHKNIKLAVIYLLEQKVSCFNLPNYV